MSPVTNHVVSQLRQLIYYHLNCNLVRNALFMAGRLQACEPKSPEAAYLLALCQLKLGEYKAAYDSCKVAGPRGAHLGCSYVFAQACLALGRYIEGSSALERCKGLWAAKNNWNKHTDTRRQHLPDAAAVYCLQGKLWHGHGDTNRAIECYAEALKLNPFMWDSFLGLCELGAHVRISNIFKMAPEMLSVLAMTTAEETSLGVLDESPPINISPQHQTTNDNVNQPPSSADPFSISKNRINGDIRPNLGSSALFEKLNGSRAAITPIGLPGGPDFEGSESPSAPGGSISNVISFGQDAGGAITALPMSTEPPLAPTRKVRTLQGLGMDISSDAPPKMRANSMKTKSRSKGDSEEGDNSIFGRAAAMNIAVGAKRTISGQVTQVMSQNSIANASSNSADPMAPQRRSVRLFNQIRPTSGKFASSTNSTGAKEGRDIKKVKATGTKGRSANGFNVGRVVSGNRNHGDPMDVDNKLSRTTSNTSNGPLNNSKPVVNEKVKEMEGLQWLLELFAKLGSGYFALCHYQCQEALQIFNSIPSSQRETPWVLSQIARAYYEQASYSEAEKVFLNIKRIAPSRLDDMELYSTILWHLKSDVDLAFLSHELNDLDRNSPQAWCALGNSNSLARKHDAALKCFKRATQLDPQFAYAFTLQGHEHVANEEYDKALYAYRAAIAADHRHYNAWYGLGKVFEKQGKYSFAEQHYRTAAAINPTNAVLVCCIGVVLEKMKNPKAALLQYTRSCDLAPKSSLSRFKKARVLMALHEPQAALVELKVLKDIAPDEANVHFLLGKVYKTLKQKGMAIKHFTTALNLDPKASHYIKEAMEQMEDEDDDDEGGMV